MTRPTDQPPHSACPDRAWLHRYHDGELRDAAVRDALERHVEACAVCAAELAALRGISRSLHAIVLPEMRGNFAGELRDAVAAQWQADLEAARWMRRLSYAMAAVLLVGIGLLSLDPRAGSSGPDAISSSKELTTTSAPARTQLAQLTLPNYAEQTEPRSDSERAVEFAQWIVDDLSSSILSTDEAVR